ncbi:hypothetical protein J6590_052779 [Homalodisca vitripennis]|nr:hypothetical protein J6590_052779 [Homalodisca vitripennis]
MEELEHDINLESLPSSGSAKAKLVSQHLHWNDRIVVLRSVPDIDPEMRSWALTASHKLIEALGEVRLVKEKRMLFTAVSPTEVPPSLILTNSPPAHCFKISGVLMAPNGRSPPEASSDHPFRPTMTTYTHFYPSTLPDRCTMTLHNLRSLLANLAGI